MPKNKLDEAVNYLPIGGALTGATIGAIDGISWTNPLPLTNVALGGAVGAIVGYQLKKTLKNKNKTKIGTSTTIGLCAGVANLTLNPNPTMMNTLEATAAGVVIGKGGKYVVGKGVKCIKTSPQYQAIKQARNIQKKINSNKDFNTIKKAANGFDMQSHSSTSQYKTKSQKI